MNALERLRAAAKAADARQGLSLAGMAREKRRRALAQGIEAQRATTENTGVVHESPVPKGCAPTQSSTPPHSDNKEKGIG